MRAMRRFRVSDPSQVIYDIAIVGSGYAGSLMAMVARRLGLSVLLLERGTHPRVVIGESSTPLSNLLLEELALRYDLPRLLPLTRWGAWQQHYPELACGLKRGFTFHHHVLGHPQPAGKDRADQLLVAASPFDAIADTHWYRADVDAFLVREAQSLGAQYLDRVHLDTLSSGDKMQLLQGVHKGVRVSFSARFVIDATGPRGFLHKTLKLQEAPLDGAIATRALYNHFTGVRRLGDTRYSRTESTPPYPIDDAAVHHVFEGGWVWVLRFNNGVTSAGVVATDAVADKLGLGEGSAAAWARVLALIPALHAQFKHSTPQHPFTYIARVAFSSATVTGKHWAMLPSAAGFVDPMLSTGFPLALLGVGRLAEIFEAHWEQPSFAEALQGYASHTRSELAATSRLVGSLYAATRSFPCFTALSLLYFAAASFAETARRLGRTHLASSFLLHDHPSFGEACRALYAQVQTIQQPRDMKQFRTSVLQTIEPFDIASLADCTRNNWYPVRAADLMQSAYKLGATQEDIAAMLAQCGFVDAAEGRSQDLARQR
jgi:FADH2 O2-dependent halogenase